MEPLSTFRDPSTSSESDQSSLELGQIADSLLASPTRFIAKNNEIKVIECNVRAARSFPFVSKVTGIDAIELATDVMLGLPVEPYPASTMPSDYVGIKVPQFSFGRLAGADPILGVEMASTGEVACFGRDKYEAYLKALISTGMTMPKKNVLLSIGSFKEKLEMLPSVQKLHSLGYNIFATAGTSDFLQEHGVPVKYLEALEHDEEDTQKSEYSLNQHLANHMIDLYVNLPSKNRYRRPANYMSKGYRSRRMAVDFAVPLVTNVKCAKLLIEALARKPSFDISSVDFKTSHRTVVLPGFINTRSFVPNIAVSGSTEIEEVTEASLLGGFTTVQILPVGLNASVEDALSLDVARTNAGNYSHCDYTLSVAATEDNATRFGPELLNAARTLFLPFTSLAGAANKVSTVSFSPISLHEHLTDCPT